MANPEKDVLGVIYHCGGITKTGIMSIAGGEQVLRNLIGRKFLKKEPITVNDKKIALYQFTDAGERYFTELTGKTNFYRCIKKQKVYLLSRFYVSEGVPFESWKNKDEWYAEGAAEAGCVPDGTYEKDGMLYGVIVLREVEKNRVKEKLKTFNQSHNLNQIKVLNLS